MHLNLVDKLQFYFDVVYIPRAVHREVNTKSRFRRKLRKLYQSGPFQKCLVANEWNLRLVLLGDGEAEALTQAQEKGANVFIGDDKSARRFGQNMGLRTIGTARLLARMHSEGFAAEPALLVRKLRKELGYYISPEILEDAIKRASQPL